ncbi:DUF6790 family protein [Flavobacterium pectinovorum]|uniref:Uncharacterized protein n=1 Tax=Flavobacterium pectinovorum TaxID=29533 RepID=A0A502EQ72_9FLAO|nr:DUF6790 family protein [Flavobacterium pectinovorum]TPG39928.1 hypothetical protein EAH81_11545 [Flavobacterium pectinovorum]
MSKKYFIGVTLMTFIIPIVGFMIEAFMKNIPFTFIVFCKWFIFSAVGLRLVVAGIQQSVKPAFTAKEIFHIKSSDSFPIIRELGFANLCFGLVGIISIYKPEWRIVSAFASGLYFGIAGLQHLIKKPVSANETYALWTDLLIFIVLLAYFILTI